MRFIEVESGGGLVGERFQGKVRRRFSLAEAEWSDESDEATLS